MQGINRIQLKHSCPVTVELSMSPGLIKGERSIPSNICLSNGIRRWNSHQNYTQKPGAYPEIGDAIIVNCQGLKQKLT